jgi:hypothetical protein
MAVVAKKHQKPPRPDVLICEHDEVYTYLEIAEALKVSVRQVRRWVEGRRFPEGGVIRFPRGTRLYGWAVNEFAAERTE